MSVSTQEIEHELLDQELLKDLEMDLVKQRQNKGLSVRLFGDTLKDATKNAKKRNPDKSDMEIFIEFSIKNGCYTAVEKLLLNDRFNKLLPNLNRGNGISYETFSLLKLASRNVTSNISDLFEKNKYLRDLDNFHYSFALYGPKLITDTVDKKEDLDAFYENVFNKEPEKSYIDKFIAFAVKNKQFKALSELLKHKNFREEMATLPNEGRGGISYESFNLLRKACKENLELDKAFKEIPYLVYHDQFRGYIDNYKGVSKPNKWANFLKTAKGKIFLSPEDEFNFYHDAAKKIGLEEYLIAKPNDLQFYKKDIDKFHKAQKHVMLLKELDPAMKNVGVQLQPKIPEQPSTYLQPDREYNRMIMLKKDQNKNMPKENQDEVERKETAARAAALVKAPRPPKATHGGTPGPVPNTTGPAPSLQSQLAVEAAAQNAQKKEPNKTGQPQGKPVARVAPVATDQKPKQSSVQQPAGKSVAGGLPAQPNKPADAAKLSATQKSTTTRVKQAETRETMFKSIQELKESGRRLQEKLKRQIGEADADDSPAASIANAADSTSTTTKLSTRTDKPPTAIGAQTVVAGSIEMPPKVQPKIPIPVKANAQLQGQPAAEVPVAAPAENKTEQTSGKPNPNTAKSAITAAAPKQPDAKPFSNTGITTATGKRNPTQAPAAAVEVSKAAKPPAVKSQKTQNLKSQIDQKAQEIEQRKVALSPPSPKVEGIQIGNPNLALIMKEKRKRMPTEIDLETKDDNSQVQVDSSTANPVDKSNKSSKASISAPELPPANRNLLAEIQGFNARNLTKIDQSTPTNKSQAVAPSDFVEGLARFIRRPLPLNDTPNPNAKKEIDYNKVDWTTDDDNPQPKAKSGTTDTLATDLRQAQQRFVKQNVQSTQGNAAPVLPQAQQAHAQQIKKPTAPAPTGKGPAAASSTATKQPGKGPIAGPPSTVKTPPPVPQKPISGNKGPRKL